MPSEDLMKAIIAKHGAVLDIGRRPEVLDDLIADLQKAMPQGPAAAPAQPTPFGIPWMDSWVAHWTVAQASRSASSRVAEVEGAVRALTDLRFDQRLREIQEFILAERGRLATPPDAGPPEPGVPPAGPQSFTPPDGGVPEPGVPDPPAPSPASIPLGGRPGGPLFTTPDGGTPPDGGSPPPGGPPTPPAPAPATITPGFGVGGIFATPDAGPPEPGVPPEPQPPGPPDGGPPEPGVPPTGPQGLGIGAGALGDNPWILYWFISVQAPMLLDVIDLHLTRRLEEMELR